jgi:prepilin-type N-terminal cleavage/methylation domain-containing protein
MKPQKSVGSAPPTLLSHESELSLSQPRQKTLALTPSSSSLSLKAERRSTGGGNKKDARVNPWRSGQGRFGAGGASEGFTLIELLVATALSAVLISAVLNILACLSRDRARLDRASAVPSPAPLLESLRWDLRNAGSMSQSARGLVLIGHGGIDPQALTPTGRLTRVTYRLVHDKSMQLLVREQEYLDDPALPQHWREIMAVGIKEFVIAADSGQRWDAKGRSMEREPSIAGQATTIPARVRVHADVLSAVADEVITTR